MVVLFARGAEGALADAAGRPAARRIVESAWAGGATPIIVVSADDASGGVAASLAGSPAVLAEPAPAEAGPVGQIARGMTLAADTVRETDACLIWPGRMTWVDAETVTSLIEAHGALRDAILRPRYDDQMGWPALVPMTLAGSFAAQDATRMPDELLAGMVDSGAELVAIDTGDPGVTTDVSTSLESLPAYEGPPEPVAGPAPDWGAAAADMPDDAPLEGPALAPYSQVSDESD